MPILSSYRKEVINIECVSSPGFLLLKKQQESKLKRLDGFTVADYFNAMEDISNGKPIKS